MNSWAYQPNALMASCVADGIVCPKPRRIGVPTQFYEPLRPPSLLIHINNQQTESCDASAATELLDIIQMKGNRNSERSSFLVASPPPFFTGSPPSRASNPIIQNENFGNDPPSSTVEAPSPTHRSGACTRVNIGSGPAPVRIEGFNCPRSCSISAVA